MDRLERVVQVLAEDQVSLRKLIGDLARDTHKRFDRVAKQFEETDRRMRETDERMRQTDERMRQTDERMRLADQRMRERDRAVDERIDQLVSAIGALIRRQNGSPK